MPITEERRRNFQCYASDVVRLHFAPDEKSFEKGCQKYYKPEMVYQIFGNRDAIYGYKDLKINMFTCTSSGDTLIELEYSEVASIDERRGIKPDDIFEMLTPWYPMGFSTNRDKFYQKINSSMHKPFGRCVSKFSFPVAGDENHTYTINLCDTNEPGFKEYHRKFEPLLIFYIESANYIELEDDRWSVLHMYEEKKQGDKFVYVLAGFCTIYNFYCNYYTNRARISQAFILPCYQRLGLGTRLLSTVYQVLFHEIPNVKEITVESPNSVFSKIRNMLDSKIVIELEHFSEENVRKGLSKKMIAEARYRAKMNKIQCNKVYNIIRMLYTNLDDEGDLALLKKQMKKRFHADLVKQHRVAVSKGGDKQKTDKLERLLTDSFLNNEYLERQYTNYFRNTRPLVDQLKHYPCVQPRRPIQLLLQTF